MSTSVENSAGSVVSLWRYPVKSMMGEELNGCDVTANGLLGDRAYALIDRADGKVATAKNPRKWPKLFDFRAAYDRQPARGSALPPVRVTLPDGTFLTSEQSDVDSVLSAALSRDVTLARHDSGISHAGTSEEYWLDFEEFEHRDTVTEFELPEGTFFDCATVHVVTTATLERLREFYPQGRFETRRFRPNIVVAVAGGESGFVENAWVSRMLSIGDVVLQVTGPCSRCVMTTLAQGDLPKDPGILRAVAQHNDANVGVYASVVHGGRIRRGDSVCLT
jgi:uncharacterized protein YcbX